MNDNDKVTRNIRWSELACKDGTPVPPEYQDNARRAARVVQTVRDFYGLPADISSGFRTLTHNAAVGGEEGSKHLSASAIDFSIRGVPAAEVRKTMLGLIRLGIIPDGGIGAYDDFTHYDIGKRRRWNG